MNIKKKLSFMNIVLLNLYHRLHCIFWFSLFQVMFPLCSQHFVVGSGTTGKCEPWKTSCSLLSVMMCNLGLILPYFTILCDEGNAAFINI